MENVINELMALVEQISAFISGLDFTALSTAISDFVAGLGL